MTIGIKAGVDAVTIRKKTAEEIDATLLAEPEMTSEDWREYQEGWKLFNAGQFWHAHEAWENVWKRRPEESRIFFQGIIQLAAAYHLLVVKKRYGGMMRNFEKAEGKLKLFPSFFLGVDVTALLVSINAARAEVAHVGVDHLDQFNTAIIPQVSLKTTSR